MIVGKLISVDGKDNLNIEKDEPFNRYKLCNPSIILPISIKDEGTVLFLFNNSWIVRFDKHLLHTTKNYRLNHATNTNR